MLDGDDPGLRRERQIHCVPHRSVNDPQPNPRDVLAVEGRSLCIEPIVERLPTEGGIGASEHLVNMPGDAIPITSWRMSSGSSIRTLEGHVDSRKFLVQ